LAARIVDKEARKAEILKAAISIFAKNGIVNTKMSEIAATAGIGKGTIYEYFRSKEDIFAEAYQTIFAGVERDIGEVLTSDLGPEDKLRKLMLISIEAFLGDGGDFAGIMMSFWSEGIRNKDERIIGIINLEEIYADYRLMIASILDEGVRQGIFQVSDTRMTASVLIGAMDGIMLQWIMDQTVFEPSNAVEVLLECYLSGIRTEGASQR